MNVKTSHGRRVHDGLRVPLTGPVVHDTRCGFIESWFDKPAWKEVDAPVDCKNCLRDMRRWEASDA